MSQGTLTTGRVLRSEWIKLRSLRSTWLTLVGILAIIVVFGGLSAAAATGSVEVGGPGGSGGTPFPTDNPVATVLSGANFAVLLVSVLGVLAGAREYASGMIRVSLSAVPARLPVLWSKALVFVGVTLPFVLVGVLVAFFVGTAILSAGDVASASWSDPGVARAVLGTVGYLVGLGVMGVALGILLRGIAGGIATLIGGLLFVPTLATSLLPESWDSVLQYLPSNAATAFSTVQPDPALLSPGQGLAVFCAWVVVAVVGAAVALRRRDA